MNIMNSGGKKLFVLGLAFFFCLNAPVQASAAQDSNKTNKTAKTTIKKSASKSEEYIAYAKKKFKEIRLKVTNLYDQLNYELNGFLSQEAFEKQLNGQQKSSQESAETAQTGNYTNNYNQDMSKYRQTGSQSTSNTSWASSKPDFNSAQSQTPAPISSPSSSSSSSASPRSS
jgi:hypothetical protein